MPRITTSGVPPTAPNENDVMRVEVVKKGIFIFDWAALGQKEANI